MATFTSELKVEDLQRELGTSDTQLDTRIEEAVIPELSACFDDTEHYVNKLGLPAGKRTDVRTRVFVHGTQSGMTMALEYWRERNPVEATFRALLLILLSLHKEDIAKLVCRKCLRLLPEVDLKYPAECTDKTVSKQATTVVTVPSTRKTATRVLLRTFPNFPLEIQEGNIVKLSCESAELAAKFESLCSSLLLSLKKRDGIKTELAHCMLHMATLQPVFEDEEQPIFRKQKEKLLKAADVDEIWEIICYYFSFFNYRLIEHIIEQLGTNENKKRMAEYKEEFEKYAKRRVYECPAEFGYTNEEDSTIIVKLDDCYDGCTLFQIEKLKVKLCEILGLSGVSLRLTTIEKGCYKLTFQMPSFIEDIVFPLSDEQQVELGNLGIVWIQCGDYEYQMVSRKNAGTTNHRDDDAGGDFDDDTSSQGILSVSVRADVYNAHPAKPYTGAFSDSGIGKTSTETLSLISDFTENLFTGDDLLQDEGNNIHDGIQQASTQLNVAAFNGNLINVRYCIEVLRCKPFEYSDHAGKTSLHVAAEGGHVHILTYLCNYCLNKSVNPATQTTTQGKTPLHIAAQNGHLALIQYFIETPEIKIDPMLKDKQHATPILDACRSGCVEAVRYLITQALHYSCETLENVISDSTKVKSTMLHFAAASGSCSLIEYLTTECKISPDVPGQFGATPFLVAAQEGHTEALRLLASLESCNVYSSTQKNKHNALHFAASKGHLETTRYLTICMKLNPAHKDSAGQTPLHLAALYGHIDIVQYFITDGHLLADLLDNKKNTPLHCASHNGSVAIVAYLVESCKCNPLCMNIKRETPLHIAAANGHLDLVKYLAIHQTIDLFYEITSYKTPLHLAMQHDQIEVILFYIQRYDHHLQASNSLGADKLLYYAVEKGHLSVVKAIAVKMKWTQQPSGYRQNQLLQLAGIKGHVNILQFLVCVKKWKYIYPTDNESLLHLAAHTGRLDVVKFLIEDLHHDPCVRNKSGSTPLHEACYTDQLDVIIYLFENTPLDNSYLDGKLMTPLHYAASEGCLKAIECLTKTFNCDITRRDINKNTPLHCATGKGHLEAVKLFVSTLGQSPDTLDGKKFTLLHIACSQGHKAIVEYLLDRNCDVSSVDSYGCTPAFYSARFGHLDILKTVTKKTADKDVAHRDNNGFTLLHHAASVGQLTIVKYLTHELSVDPNLVGNSGETPLHIACSQGHKDVAQYLVSECRCEIMPTKDGVYPIHLTAEAGHLNIFKWLTLTLGIDPLCREHNGSTPLHYAARNFHLNIVEFCFTELNVSPMITSSNGYTALHHAIIPHQQLPPVNTDKVLQKFTHQILLPEERAHSSLAHHASKSESTKQVEMIKLLIRHGCDPASRTKSYRQSALHIAAYQGFLQVVKLLLSAIQVNPEIPDSTGMTPLHYACIQGHLKVVDALAAKRTSPEDDVGRTPLHLAAQYGHLKVVKLLTSKKSHPPYCKDKDGLTPLHYAVVNGFLEIVKFLLSNFPVNLTTTFTNVATPFQLACLFGHKHIANYLLNTGQAADDLTQVLFAIIKNRDLNMVQYVLSLKEFDKGSHTFRNCTFHYAAAMGNLDIVCYLISNHGFSPDVLGNYALTPLHIACMHGNADIANYLLSLPNCNAHAVTTDKDTALHFASQKGLLDIVKILTLQKGCRVHQRELNGNNSLHFAAMHGHLSVVKFFTQELKCNPSILGEEGWTPLHFAANYGRLKVLKFLVATLKVDLNTREIRDQATPLHLACLIGNFDIVKYLSGVYKARKMRDPLDSDGKTPLHYAARLGDLSIVKFLALQRGYDPMCVETAKGHTPLHLAAEGGHADVVAFLVFEMQCNPYTTNYYGQTPIDLWTSKSLSKYEFGYKQRELHKAAENGEAGKVIKLINDNKEDVNHCDTLNRTPLHYAAMGGSFIVVNRLILAGADPLSEDVFHNIPIHYAAALGHLRAADRLLKYSNPLLVRGVLNMTPIDMAFAAHHYEIVHQLKERYSRIDLVFEDLTSHNT